LLAAAPTHPFLMANRELPVNPEAEAKPAQERADALFGRRIAADAAHVPGTADSHRGH